MLDLEQREELMRLSVPSISNLCGDNKGRLVHQPSTLDLRKIAGQEREAATYRRCLAWTRDSRVLELTAGFVKTAVGI